MPSSLSAAPRGHLLIVEDDEAIRFVMQSLLEMEGYKVSVATNGKEALDLVMKASKNGSLPCIILLDLMLPVMTGWELLDRLRSNAVAPGLANLPVVITSAAVEAAATADRQAQGYLKKPIDMDALLEKVKQYCAG